MASRSLPIKDDGSTCFGAGVALRTPTSRRAAARHSLELGVAEELAPPTSVPLFFRVGSRVWARTTRRGCLPRARPWTSAWPRVCSTRRHHHFDRRKSGARITCSSFCESRAETAARLLLAAAPRDAARGAPSRVHRKAPRRGNDDGGRLTTGHPPESRARAAQGCHDVRWRRAKTVVAQERRKGGHRGREGTSFAWPTAGHRCCNRRKRVVVTGRMLKWRQHIEMSCLHCCTSRTDECVRQCVEAAD